MSIYAERFESSSIKGFLEATIAELEAIDLAQLGSNYRDIVVRTKHVVTTVIEQLNEVDPEFLSASLVESLGTAARHLTETARHCKREGAWNELTNVCDGMLHYIAQIPSTWRLDKSLKSTNREVAKYKKEVGNALADANAALEKLTKATASVNDRVAAIEQCALKSTTELDNRVGAVGKELESLEAARAELSEGLAHAKEELDELHHATKALVDQIEAEAKEHEGTRQERFEKWLLSKESQWSTSESQLKSDFTSHINQWSTEANNAANARQSQFSAELDRFKSLLSSLQAEHIRAWEELAALWGKTFSELETEQQRAHSDSRDEASRAFQSLGEQCTSEFSELLEKFKKRAEATVDDYNRQGAELISSLAEKDIQARTLVGLIGDTGVTGNYQKIANRELESANWMRRTAIGAIIVVTALVGIIIWEIRATEFVWEVMLFRLLAGLPLLGLAWYCGKESSRHRTNEERNRRIELELAALSPYLHQLPDDKAILVRESLTAKYFGNESTGQLENSESLGTMLRMLSKNLEPIIEFAKKFNK